MTRPTLTATLAVAGFVVAAAAGARAAGAEGSIVDAARRGDRQRIQTLAQAGRVNETAPDGSTALHWAVENDDLEMVRVLLKAGAKATAATRYDVQPISLAAVNGNAAVIEVLNGGKVTIGPR